MISKLISCLRYFFIFNQCTGNLSRIKDFGLAYDWSLIRGDVNKIRFGKGARILGRVVFVLDGDGIINIGDNVTIEDGAYINSHGGEITIGNNVFIGRGAIIQGMGGVIIGANSMMGPNSQIYSSNHIFKGEDVVRKSLQEKCSPVLIGENCWLCANSIITAGVTINQDEVVLPSIVRRPSHLEV
tara:strand:- start:10022 stop:10576 length:555 start_codon:yes stop_codon:yes gene_type:complete